MESRPRLTLPLTAADRLAEGAGRLLLLGLWAWVGLRYAGLPARMPTHYGPGGQADRFGGKSAVFLPLVLATLVYWGLNTLGRYPHIYNYLRPITPANAAWQYTAATRLVRALKLAVVLVFALAIGQDLQTAHAATPVIGAWLLPLALGLVLGPLLVYAVVVWRRRP